MNYIGNQDFQAKQNHKQDYNTSTSEVEKFIFNLETYCKVIRLLNIIKFNHHVIT